jgi:hypothetical protein
MNPADKITMALLAARVAQQALELLTMDDITLCHLQMREIFLDVNALHKHLDSVAAKQKVRKEVIPPPPGGRP